MVWSSISAYGYCREINETRPVPKGITKQNDSASRRLVPLFSIHVHANKIKEFLHSNEISILPWPRNSPDMNPIENIWSIVKLRMKKERITEKRGLIEC